MLYCAYGSNMNLFQMAYRCPNSNIVGTGKLHGWELVFNLHADIIETEHDNVTPVVVWDIADEDWDALDVYEGYPTYYIRRNVEVEFDNGQKNIATVYVMADNQKGVCPPTKRYFDGIIEGCIANGIDVKYLYDALEQSYGSDANNDETIGW